MFRAMIAAFSIYSRIPMPKIRWEERDMRYVMCFFPLVGVVLGGAQWGVWLLLEKTDLQRFFTAAILTVLPILLTGGIHLDGWMDTHDAIHSWKDREGRLEILKDPHVGAFAVISAILLVVLTVAGYTEIRHKTMGAVAMSFVLSRILSGLSVVTFPKLSAKGSVRAIGDNSPGSVRWILTAEMVLTMALMGLLFHGIGAAACAAALMVYAYYYEMSRRRFGGINGDLAGYFLCLCELVILLATAVLGKVLS